MTTQHTPGPWPVGDAGATVFGPPNGNPSPATIARVSFAMIPSDEMVANARLIAAAPDLLAALGDAWRSLDRLADEPDNMHAWQEATRVAMACRAAIAKAEGRS